MTRISTVVLFLALASCSSGSDTWLASNDASNRQGRFNCLFGAELRACQAVVSDDPRFPSPSRGY